MALIFLFLFFQTIIYSHSSNIHSNVITRKMDLEDNQSDIPKISPDPLFIDNYENEIFSSDVKVQDVKMEILRCKYCNENFNCENDLEAHVSFFHNYKCSICNTESTIFRGYVDFKRHLILLHKKSSNNYYCKICDAEYISLEQFIQHVKKAVHQKINNHKCDCGTSFGRKADLIKHIRKVHEGMKMDKCYKCAFCDKTFLKNHSLKLHTGKKHSASKIVDVKHNNQDTSNEKGNMIIEYDLNSVIEIKEEFDINI